MRRLWRVVRAWLLPARYLEAAAGWLQLGWIAAILIVPAAVVSTLSETTSDVDWTTPWAVVASIGALLGLALVALWRATPTPRLSLSLGPVQTPYAVDHTGNVALDQNGNPVQTRYFHREVHSSSPVVNCTGELIGVEEKKVGRREPDQRSAEEGLEIERPGHVYARPLGRHIFRRPGREIIREARG